MATRTLNVTVKNNLSTPQTYFLLAETAGGLTGTGCDINISESPSVTVIDSIPYNFAANETRTISQTFDDSVHPGGSAFAYVKVFDSQGIQCFDGESTTWTATGSISLVGHTVPLGTFNYDSCLSVGITISNTTQSSSTGVGSFYLLNDINFGAFNEFWISSDINIPVGTTTQSLLIPQDSMQYYNFSQQQWLNWNPCSLNPPIPAWMPRGVPVQLNTSLSNGGLQTLGPESSFIVADEGTGALSLITDVGINTAQQAGGTEIPEGSTVSVGTDLWPWWIYEKGLSIDMPLQLTIVKVASDSYSREFSTTISYTESSGAGSWITWVGIRFNIPGYYRIYTRMDGIPAHGSPPFGSGGWNLTVVP
jgi:hypothetical protein